MNLEITVDAAAVGKAYRKQLEKSDLKKRLLDTISSIERKVMQDFEGENTLGCAVKRDFATAAHRAMKSQMGKQASSKAESLEIAVSSEDYETSFKDFWKKTPLAAALQVETTFELEKTLEGISPGCLKYKIGQWLVTEWAETISAQYFEGEKNGS